MRNPVTSQTVHSECPRPQPREAKTVSHLEQSIMTRVTFRMNLIQPSKGIERKLLAVRRSLSLVVLHDEHGRWIKKKAEETIPRRDDERATAWPCSLFGGNEKVPHASKWQDIKDKRRNMTISDARK